MPVVAMVDAASPSGYARTNLTVENKMAAYDLQILLRGPEQDVLRLKPKQKKSLWLEPGDYAVGMFAPGQCEVKPRHTSWKIEPFVHHTIRGAAARLTRTMREKITARLVGERAIGV